MAVIQCKRFVSFTSFLLDLHDLTARTNPSWFLRAFSLTLFLPLSFHQPHFPLHLFHPSFLSMCSLASFPYIPSVLLYFSLFPFPRPLSLCPSSRSWIISGLIQRCLSRWHSHVHTQQKQLQHYSKFLASVKCKWHHKWCFQCLCFPSLSSQPLCFLPSPK